MSDDPKPGSRRGFLDKALRALGLLFAGGMVGHLAARDDTDDMVWQIDPDKCIGCGRCATECVLALSAVKCVHEWPRCGYCELCFGYYVDQRVDDLEVAENQRCPTDAIKRAPVEDPYYEYIIDEPKCIGCGLCVKGCNDYGNGSLVLQVRHDRCLNCNECSIARACPANAFQRVPREHPYLLRTLGDEDLHEEPAASSAPEPFQRAPEPAFEPAPDPGASPEPLDLPAGEPSAIPPTAGGGLGPPELDGRMGAGDV